MERKALGITSRLLLERLPTIETPPGYDDLRAIESWAGPIANCDWHQESEEWRLTIPKIWDHATKAPEEVVA